MQRQPRRRASLSGAQRLQDFVERTPAGDGDSGFLEHPAEVRFVVWSGWIASDAERHENLLPPGRGRSGYACALRTHSPRDFGIRGLVERRPSATPIAHGDRKSTRLNSSHVEISYAVFC